MVLASILLTENEIKLFKKLISNYNQKQINVKIIEKNINIGYVYGIGYVYDNQNIIFPTQAI